MARGLSLRAGEGPRSRGACEAHGSRWSPPAAFERQRRRRVVRAVRGLWGKWVVAFGRPATETDARIAMTAAFWSSCDTNAAPVADLSWVVVAGRPKGRTNPRPAPDHP